MSSLYFGLDVQYTANSKLEFDPVFNVQCTLYSPQLAGGQGYVSNSGTLASNTQNTASPKYNNDISLLISQTSSMVKCTDYAQQLKLLTVPIPIN